jgi:signal transduction histidine kinase
VTQDPHFAELVSVACHDLRTPLATVYGFARTLERLELEEPAGRYLEMIGTASGQIGELLDQLALAARIQTGRYAPTLVETDSLALARSAVDELEEGRVEVSGEGAPVRVDLDPTRRALGQLARAAARHGGHESVELVVHGAELDLSPVTSPAAPVVLGERMLELGAPAASMLIRAMGGSLVVEDERLLIRLPEGE